MVIFGVSQSTGVERQLKLDRAGTGILLSIVDHVGEVERERIIAQTDDIMAALVAPMGQKTIIDGEAPASGKKKHLEMEMARNEVLLRCHEPASEGCDVAVGSDDFQDALEQITGPE